MLSKSRLLWIDIKINLHFLWVKTRVFIHNPVGYIKARMTPQPFMQVTRLPNDKALLRHHDADGNTQTIIFNCNKQNTRCNSSAPQI